MPKPKWRMENNRSSFTYFKLMDGRQAVIGDMTPFLDHGHVCPCGQSHFSLSEIMQHLLEHGHVLKLDTELQCTTR